MSHFSNGKLSLQFTTLILSSVALLAGSSWAQDGFRPNGGSAYSNGRVQQSTPGISKFDPGKRQSSNSTFGRSAALPQAPGNAARQDGGYESDSLNLPSIGSSAKAGTSYVEYKDEIEVPALETGQLIDVNVEQGDAVAAGGTIARIDDVIPRLQLEQAKVRIQNADRIANDATSIEAAVKQIQLTSHRYQTARRLELKGARSADERMTAKYEYDVARLQRQAAEKRQLEAMGEAALENVRKNEVSERIRRHNITALFDGVVIQRFKQKGEWVQAGEPIVKIARMNKLYVTRLVSNNRYNPADVKGKNVIVTAELAHGETVEFRGKITAIGPRDVSGDGNEFKVKAEIENKRKQGEWILRKNSRVSMKILSDE